MNFSASIFLLLLNSSQRIILLFPMDKTINLTTSFLLLVKIVQQLMDLDREIITLLYKEVDL